MTEESTLSSPNHMVWELFQSLRRLCLRVAESHVANDGPAIRQDSALCIILSVQCVEAFFNVFFRVLIDEPAYAHAANRIGTELSKTNFGLDKKIKDWPLLAFGQKIPLDRGAAQKFITLKNFRHQLMHFKSTHETFAIPGVALHSLTDTSAYHALSANAALEALHTAEEFICEVFRLRGIPPEDFPHALHAWTGRPPIWASSSPAF